MENSKWYDYPHPRKITLNADFLAPFFAPFDLELFRRIFNYHFDVYPANTLPPPTNTPSAIPTPKFSNRTLVKTDSPAKNQLATLNEVFESRLNKGKSVSINVRNPTTVDWNPNCAICPSTPHF